MMIDLKLSMVTSNSHMVRFWELFDIYISELSKNASLGDEFDLDYFNSEEYRGAIEKLRTRTINPLRIFFISNEQSTIGFLMYVTYFDEGGKCFLMEYYINPNYRNLGIGKLAYSKAESHIDAEGALYIELTPTNESNERFWNSVGFKKSTDVDDDNKYFYRKYL